MVKLDMYDLQQKAERHVADFVFLEERNPTAEELSKELKVNVATARELIGRVIPNQ